jgi:hypothetical protein
MTDFTWTHTSTDNGFLLKRGVDEISATRGAEADDGRWQITDHTPDCFVLTRGVTEVLVVQRAPAFESWPDIPRLWRVRVLFWITTRLEITDFSLYEAV